MTSLSLLRHCVLPAALLMQPFLLPAQTWQKVPLRAEGASASWQRLCAFKARGEYVTERFWRATANCGEVKQLALGAGSTYHAVTRQGALYWWNRSNLMTPTAQPQFRSGGVANVASANSGYCALTTAGGLKCWGHNGYNNLGTGVSTATPTDVVGLSSGVASFALSMFNGCAVTAAGSLKCWGQNAAGNVGDGTTTNRPTPVDVPGLSSGVNRVAFIGNNTCAFMTNGGVKCWGNFAYPDWGMGALGTSLVPRDIDVSKLPISVSTVVYNQSTVCGLTSVGGVKCRGAYDQGPIPSTAPLNFGTAFVDVPGLTSDVVSLVAGYNFNCALTRAGAVKCWGSSGYGWYLVYPSDWTFQNYGQLGAGSAVTSSLNPVDVVGLSSGVVSLTAGQRNACAVMQNGGIKCWGCLEYDEYNHVCLDNRPTPKDLSLD